MGRPRPTCQTSQHNRRPALPCTDFHIFPKHSHIIKTFYLNKKIIHDPFGPFLPGTRSKPRLLWQNTLLNTLLKKECKKKCLWRSLPLTPRLLVASGGTGEARGRATPPFPLHCSHPRGTTLHQGPIPPASGIGHNAGRTGFSSGLLILLL